MKEVKPKIYESVIPLRSYKMAADYLSRVKKDTQTALDTRYSTVGTPAQLGASNAGYKMQEQAAYLSSLPSTDKYMKELTGTTTDSYAPVKEVASQTLSEAQKSYGEALQNADQKPPPIDSTTPPSWSTGTIAAGLPAMPPGMEEAMNEAAKRREDFQNQRQERIASFGSRKA